MTTTAQPTQSLAAMHQDFLVLAEASTDHRAFQPGIIWGELQTADYIRATYARLRRVLDISDEEIDAAVITRLARGRLLGQDNRAFHVLLGEHAITSVVGGADVMRAQLHHLLDHLDTPHLRLGIIPAAAELEATLPGGFAIYNGVRVEIDSLAGPQTITEMPRIQRFTATFDLLARSAVYGPDARALIETAHDRI
ncbi:DUF5753 domain-containing protein [Kitasatospora sp. NPDC094019]|uniref:DUF5753 domain-containing protein n=1 Tax=Kitasatospora sp. NPDC094019 TaxID=3364091 RepID=UPI00382531BA